MLLNEIGNILDVSADRGTRYVRCRPYAISDLDNALITAQTPFDIGDHQSPGIQAVLIFRALHEGPPQLVDGSVSPPQETTDDDVKGICAYDKGPIGLAPQILGGHPKDDVGKGFHILTDIGGLCKIDGYNDGATYYGQADEHVATHASDAQKDGAVHANGVHVVFFIGLEDWTEPGKQGLVHGRGFVAFVGVTQTGRVYDFVPGAEYAEGEEYTGGDAQRSSYGYYDGTSGDLFPVSMNMDGFGSGRAYFTPKGIRHEVQELVREADLPREHGPRDVGHCGGWSGQGQSECGGGGREGTSSVHFRALQSSCKLGIT